MTHNIGIIEGKLIAMSVLMNDVEEDLWVTLNPRGRNILIRERRFIDASLNRLRAALKKYPEEDE